MHKAYQEVANLLAQIAVVRLGKSQVSSVLSACRSVAFPHLQASCVKLCDFWAHAEECPFLLH